MMGAMIPMNCRWPDSGTVSYHTALNRAPWDPALAGLEGFSRISEGHVITNYLATIVALLALTGFSPAEAGRHSFSPAEAGRHVQSAQAQNDHPKKVEIVSVTGCLREQGTNNWMIVAATDPVVSS